MAISPDAARALAGALLQLNPLLGLTLIWTETRLSEREDPRGSNRRRRSGNSQRTPPILDRVTPFEWFIFVVFLHSITWPIMTIAGPTTLSVKVALANSILWIALAVGRIIYTITLSGRKEQVLFWGAVTASWFPLWGMVVAIEVESKPAPPAVVTPSTQSPSPRPSSSPTKTADRPGSPTPTTTRR